MCYFRKKILYYLKGVFFLFRVFSEFRFDVSLKVKRLSKQRDTRGSEAAQEWLKEYSELREY